MTGFIADDEFRAMLDWFMCSDPWPVSGDAGERQYDEIEKMLNRYAKIAHYENWTEAFHGFLAA